MEIKVATKVNALDDFFADMTPKVEVKPSALLPEELNGNALSQGVDTLADDKSVSEGTASLNFAVENIEVCTSPFSAHYLDDQDKQLKGAPVAEM